MISSNSSASDATLQIITGDEDVAESSAQGAARALALTGRQEDGEDIPATFLIARSVLIHMQWPSLYTTARSLKNAIFPPMNLIKTFFSTNHNSVKNVPDRRVARKLCFDDSPLMDSDALVPDSYDPEYEIIQSKVDVSVKRARVTQKKHVQVTTAVRRSPRNNIYKGFKVNMPTDSRKVKSKVSNRVIPDINTPSKDVFDPAEMDSPPVSPPTPIPVLQKIGINICGIPEQELEKEKLEKSDSDDEP
jgi:hypothetical protein